MLEMDEIKEKIILAMRMPAKQLIDTYKNSLELKENPLSEIYENEILKRLWGGFQEFKIANKEGKKKKG